MQIAHTNELDLLMDLDAYRSFVRGQRDVAERRSRVTFGRCVRARARGRFDLGAALLNMPLTLRAVSLTINRSPSPSPPPSASKAARSAV
jgi:hypothetical protein